MRKLILFLSVLALFGCGQRMEGTVVPAYYYNQDLWDRTVDAPVGDKMFFVVINPASGPGTVTDPNYTEFIEDLVDSEKVPVGYIHTDWGKRSLNEVKEEVDRWLELYSDIRGFFIDEVATSEDELNYYASLSRYIKEKGNYYVVLNPGTMPSPGYFRISDAVVVFEDSLSNIGNLSTPPDRRKSACIVYSVPEEIWEETFEEIRDRCGFIYLTDDESPNPYDTLPVYFEDEMEKIAYDSFVE